MVGRTVDRIVELLLFLGAVAAIVFGFSQLTFATAGVGLFAVAGVLAVFMRIAQAGRHQSETEDWLEKISQQLARLENQERE